MDFSKIFKQNIDDRVSAIFLIIMITSVLIQCDNEDIELIFDISGFIALSSCIIWDLFILPKVTNPAILSRKENIAFIIQGILWITFLFIRAIVPNIFPSWTNIILVLILFAWLTYFALSNPSPAKEMQPNVK